MLEFLKNGKSYSIADSTGMFSGKSIMIAIDSSKSNSALIVSDTSQNILADFEFRGGGKDIDVYDLCKHTRAYLKRIFKGASIAAVGMENIITKKEDNYHGLEIHYSRAVITAVFNNFIFYFQEYHDIMPELINNNTWKTSILPEEYRKRKYEKGSLEYFRAMNSPWGKRKDDITDAVCIMMHMWKSISVVPIRHISTLSAYNGKYNVSIYPIGDYKNYNVIKFIPAIGEKTTIDMLMQTVVSNLNKGEIGYLECDIKNLDLEFIYLHTTVKEIPLNAERVALFLQAA